jgi:hypothetical protein
MSYKFLLKNNILDLLYSKLNNFLLKILQNYDTFIKAQYLEGCNNFPHPHLEVKFYEQVPEVRRNWRIW